ncbi:MAG: hypothetical protein M3Z04_00890 [Chloroflexota bacterium]|nr:hypothetical protein [Chloroflexota bacterium]
MMRLLKSCGCLILVLLVVSILLVISLWVLLIHAYAAPPLAPGTVLLAPARPAAAPNPQPHGVFLRRRVSIPVPDPTCAVQLAGDAAGTQPFAVDDRLTLNAYLPGGSVRRWVHDFRDHGRILALPPTTVSAALGPDLRDLEVILEDLEPDTWGNSDLWLLPCAGQAIAAPAISPAAPRLTAAAAPTRALPTVSHLGAPPPSAALPWPAFLIPALCLIGGALVWRHRRPAAQLPTYVVNVYDPNGRSQLQENLPVTRLPIGIARTPLRWVPAAAPEAVCVLVPTDRTGVALRSCSPHTLQVQVDGGIPQVLADTAAGGGKLN